VRSRREIVHMGPRNAFLSGGQERRSLAFPPTLTNEGDTFKKKKPKALSFQNGWYEIWHQLYHISLWPPLTAESVGYKVIIFVYSS